MLATARGRARVAGAAATRHASRIESLRARRTPQKRHGLAGCFRPVARRRSEALAHPSRSWTRNLARAPPRARRSDRRRSCADPHSDAACARLMREVIRGHQRSSEGIRRSSEGIRGHQRSSRPSEVIRGHQRSSEVIRGHQRPSEVIRGHQRSPEVIRGHQRSSEAIRGHQRGTRWHSARS